MRKGQRFYLGHTFMQKGIQRPVFTAANGFDTGRDLFIIDGIDAVYAEDPQCHQRQKGKPQMRLYSRVEGIYSSLAEIWERSPPVSKIRQWFSMVLRVAATLALSCMIMSSWRVWMVR